MDRYTRRPSDGECVCTTCGSLVGNHLAHDLFHNRLNLMYDAIPVSMTSVTATDWQAAHDAGEDEELFPGAARTCVLCGHRGRFLGGSVTEPDGTRYDLCHGCGDEDHDCYHQWTVYGDRPKHDDPCDCDDCIAANRERLHLTLRDEADQREGHLNECRMRPGRHDPDDPSTMFCICPELRAAEARVRDEFRVTIHACPPEGSGVMPCCGKTPFEVLTDRMTLDPQFVNCTGGKGYTAGWMRGVRDGHRKGVQAARSVVAALRHPLCLPFADEPGHGDNCGCLLQWKSVDDALAALKEKP